MCIIFHSKIAWREMEKERERERERERKREREEKSKLCVACLRED